MLFRWEELSRDELEKIKKKIESRVNAYKKAIVTLKEGDTIDFYSNI